MQQRSASLTLAAPRREIDRVGEPGRPGGRRPRRLRPPSRASPATRGGILELRVPSNRLDTAIERLSRPRARARAVAPDARTSRACVVSARERLSDARAERKTLLRPARRRGDGQRDREHPRAAGDRLARDRRRPQPAGAASTTAPTSPTCGVALVPQRRRRRRGRRWTPGDAFDDALRVLEVMAGVRADRGRGRCCRSRSSGCWPGWPGAASPAAAASARSTWPDRSRGAVACCGRHARER